MQQGQNTSKKWVDFSDDSEDQLGSDSQKPQLGRTQSMPPGLGDRFNNTVDHRSEQFIQQQLKKFNQARERTRFIWVVLESEDQHFLDKKVRDLKDSQNEDIPNFYNNRDIKNAWDVKVAANILQKWIKDGLDKDRIIKVTVAMRNFKPREQGDRPRGDRRGRRGGGDRNRGGDRADRGGQRGDRGGQRGERRGRGRRQDRGEGGRNRNNEDGDKKKVYVDKNTGKVPNNKQECEQQIIQQKQRHYSRQQAERVGAQLGNFRNKPKVQVQPQTKPETKPEQAKKPKEQVKPWSRKQTFKEEKEDKGKKVQYKEKPQEQKKKSYVRVDNLTEKQKEQMKKKPPKQSNGLLSEDSN